MPYCDLSETLSRRGYCATFAFSLFFFNDTATTEIYTLSLHDALPISSAVTRSSNLRSMPCACRILGASSARNFVSSFSPRSEEHTSELQSHSDLVCRLLLEKKKKKTKKQIT